MSRQGRANGGAGRPLISRRAALNGLGAGVIAGYSGGLDRIVSPAAAQSAADISRGAPSGEWATGGTAAMRGVAAYPDPFARPDAACSLTCEQILGPCWAPKAPVRQDISEAEPGIPMRMALRLVQSDGCTPISGAEVEVWHTNLDGVYSAEDVEAGELCTQGDPRAVAGYFFRGRAVADGDGRLVFDGCYPGWYGGRALHVHLLVRDAANVGDAHTRNASTVTQLYFPESLTEEIFATVPGYRDMGQPNVTNSRDNVLRRMSNPDAYVFGVEQMADGAMQVWKTISISDGESCGSRQMGRGGFGGGGRFSR
jgi:protocatechuate 3,4-dioxygenase beta subunit